MVVGTHVKDSLQKHSADRLLEANPQCHVVFSEINRINTYSKHAMPYLHSLLSPPTGHQALCKTGDSQEYFKPD